MDYKISEVASAGGLPVFMGRQMEGTGQRQSARGLQAKIYELRGGSDTGQVGKTGLERPGVWNEKGLLYGALRRSHGEMSSSCRSGIQSRPRVRVASTDGGVVISVLLSSLPARTRRYIATSIDPLMLLWSMGIGMGMVPVIVVVAFNDQG